MPKVLIVGVTRNYYHREMCFFRGFERCGCNTSIYLLNTHDPYNWGGNRTRSKFVSLASNAKEKIFWRLIMRNPNDLLLDLIKKDAPDLIVIIKGLYVHPETLLRIKEISPLTMVFIFNNENPFTDVDTNTNPWVRSTIKYYDAYFTYGHFLVEPLKKAGAKRVEYLPFAYDPELFYPVTPTPEDVAVYGSPIAFIGTFDKEREWWFNHLLDYPLAIWGSGWEKANSKLRAKWRGKRVYGGEYSKVCSCSGIVLNFLRKYDIPSHTARTFEVPACKAFMLATRTPEHQEFFEEGREADYFSSPQELIRKINFYLERADLRKEIAERAYKKVFRHTYEARARRILEVYRELATGKRNGAAAPASIYKK